MTDRDQWRAQAYQLRDVGVGNGVRLLLTLLADHMDHNCQVSVPRASLAAQLRVSETEIRNRIKVARDVGVLRIFARGYRGHTAVYQGVTLTDRGALCGTPNSELRGICAVPLTRKVSSAGELPPNGRKGVDSGYPVPPSSSKRNHSETFTSRSDVGQGEPKTQQQKEEEADAEPGPRLAACSDCGSSLDPWDTGGLCFPHRMQVAS